ncbi:MAG: RNA-directed DNA polymerase [Bdellovibrionales bacterium]|nr:RNA-directed DNA polymerase [Massilia sp.]
MIPAPSVALALADTLLAGEASPDGLAASAASALGTAYAWGPAMCGFILQRTGDKFRYFSRHELAAIILDSDAFHAAFEPGKEAPQIKRYCLQLPVRPEPDAWLSALSLPAIPTLGELALLLNVELQDLGWFADQWRRGSAEAAPLQHYHYRWVAKRSGGWRLIEIPKQRLRRMQQTILRKILEDVPVHGAAHGFRRGHSCVTHAALHAGQRVVIRMDLKDFFPSIQASRIHALFSKLGYSDSVAGTLARLCTSRAPASAFADPHTGGSLPWAARRALRSPHLPQGSPCSPALANLCAWRLDLRLDALCGSIGATYSRYADDLVFSGGREFERSVERFHVQVAAIAIEEAFGVNTRKTRVMRAGVRQQVTGVVINQHPNLRRDEFDRLKAVLTNCARHGPVAQNREGRENYWHYLAGKVAWVKMLNPARGAKLEKVFAGIDWPEAGSGSVAAPASESSS